MLIFKIMHAAEWEDVREAELYYGTPKDKEDGYIHFSTSKQLRETIERYYAGAGDLILVAVDPKPLVDALKWEHSLSRGEYFPHLFAPLPLSAVKWSRRVHRDVYGDPILYPLT